MASESIRVHDAYVGPFPWFRMMRVYPHIELRTYNGVDVTAVTMDRAEARRLVEWLNEWLADE